MTNRKFDDLRAKPDEISNAIPSSVRSAFRQVFASPQGQAVLDHLRSTTQQVALSGDASDSALRHLEGQRFLVRRIEDLAKPDRKA